MRISRGLFRLALAATLSLAVHVIVFDLAREPIEAFLKWFDFLSASPGLSGLLLLVCSPLAFLIACMLAQWVVRGFTGEAR